jgi:hypothetical protein
MLKPAAIAARELVFVLHPVRRAVVKIVAAAAAAVVLATVAATR